MKNNFIKIVGGVVGVKLLCAFLGFGVSLLIARELSLYDAGEFFTQLSIIIILASVAAFGFNNYCLRHISSLYSNDKNKEANSLITLCICLIIIFGLIICGIYFLLEYFFPRLINLNGFEYYIFVIIPIALTGLMSNVQQAAGKPKLSMFFTGGIRNFLFICAFYIYAISNTVESKYAFMFASVLSMLLSFLVWRKLKGRFTLGKGIISKSVNVMRESCDYWIIAIIAILSGQLPLIFTGLLSTYNESAEFAVSTRIAAVSSMLLIAINRVISPDISVYYFNRDIEKLRLLVNKSTKAIALFSILSTVFFVFFSSEILVLFGSEYLGAKDVFWVILLGQFVNGIFGSVGTILQMTGFAGEQRQAVKIAMFISIVIGALFIPSYGALGAAFMVATFLFFSNLISWYFVKVKVGVNTLSIYREWLK